MSQRNAEKLVPPTDDHVQQGKADIKGPMKPYASGSEAMKEPLDKDRNLVTMDFPRPTRLTEIIVTIAKWNQYTIIMEPKLDRSIQIFSPLPMSQDDGFKVFLAALQTVGLRAVFMGPNTFKISELSSNKREI